MRVFISHARTDEPLFRKVSAALENVGLEVWNDREIMSGDNWTGKVARALRESEAMVVLLTPDALRSSWVRKEIEFALGDQGYNRRLIPVLVGDPKDLAGEDVPWILRRLHIIRLADQGGEEEGIRRIADALLEVA